MRTETQSTWQRLYKHWFCKYYKVHEDCIEFDNKQAENIKNAQKQKASFPKKSVEYADLYKPVLNKIMTTYE